MKDKKHSSIGFAIIGCGHIGKRHAEMIRRMPQASLIALVDTKSIQSLRLDDFADIPFYNDLDSMLLVHSSEIDVVCIATPNGLHANQAIKVLRYGKHVVIEKPIALKKIDAERIVFEAFRCNRLVFSVMQNRYSPTSVWLKDIIDQNVLGKIYMVQVNCFWNRDERYYKNSEWHGTQDLDGGTLFTQFSHFIDMLFWLLGDFSDVKSTFACFNHSHLTDFEDSGIVHFRLRDGGIGTFSFTTSVWDKNFESSIVIIAEKGCVKVGGQYMNLVEYCHIKDYIMPNLEPTNPANDYGVYKGSAANHHYVFENVIDVLNGKNIITTNALEGLKVVEIINNFYASGKKIRSNVPLLEMEF